MQLFRLRMNLQEDFLQAEARARCLRFPFKAIFIKPLTMFQLEVNNQLSHIIKDIPREEQKNAVGMFRAYMGIAIGAYIYNDLYEK